jgi:hypothetical protein
MRCYRPTALALSSGEEWTAYVGDSNGNVTAFARTHADAATTSSSSNTNNNGTNNSTTATDERYRSGSYTGGASLAVAPAIASTAGTARVALLQKSCSVLSDGSGGAGGLGATVKAMTAAQLGLGHVSVLLYCLVAVLITVSLHVLSLYVSLLPLVVSQDLPGSVTHSLPLIISHS